MTQMPLAEFADKVGEIMFVISREYARQQASEFYKLKITLPQILILDYLRQHKEAKMTDLAHSMNVTTAAMTGVVARLVRDGYLERINDPRDRRIVKVALTPKGAKLGEKLHYQRRQMTIDIFGKISQKEREDYLKILMHIRDHLT